VVESIEQLTVYSPYSKKEEERLKWTFKLAGGKFDDVSVSGLTSLSTGPKSTLRGWLGAFYDGITGGNGVDLDEVEGQACIVSITHSKKTRDDGNPWCNVGDVSASDESDPLEPKSKSSGPVAWEVTEDEVTETTTTIRTPKKASKKKKKASKKKVSVPADDEDLEDLGWDD